MASNLPVFWRFSIEDYKDMPSSFADFISKLNIFSTGTYNIIDGGITFQNLQQSVYTFEITGGNTSVTTFNFVNPLSIQPSVVIIGHVLQSSAILNPVSTIVHCQSWTFDGTNINLPITGLTAGVAYTITVFIA
jgi:hypothetical protein